MEGLHRGLQQDHRASNTQTLAATAAYCLGLLHHKSLSKKRRCTASQAAPLALRSWRLPRPCYLSSGLRTSLRKVVTPVCMHLPGFNLPVQLRELTTQCSTCFGLPAPRCGAVIPVLQPALEKAERSRSPCSYVCCRLEQIWPAAECTVECITRWHGQTLLPSATGCANCPPCCTPTDNYAYCVDAVFDAPQLPAKRCLSTPRPPPGCRPQG